ncbi:XRE family transcriptional regulator [Pseudaminobacter salicylatoxidans]|uniref:XRE family transcriptional regulator n=1 Tax=Pseudaminobacter salicylatoxidans TaxID=93369 RepID=A0A316C4D6_PSESE|nr:XRE family transcriptional regulator [Pseudaminobacter salicylatoxidans]PWJ84418.1 XRE family transcriptional regulator [Pseudaminobacter salicylatoxidans]
MADTPTQRNGGKASPRIGHLLRERRRQLDLTLDAVASATSLTKGFLSDIERDKTSPSVASLVKLCDVLGMPVGDLFSSSESAVVKANERAPIKFGGTGVSDHLLTPSGSLRLQAIWTEIAPRGTGGEQLYALRSEEEFIIVLSGELALQLEDETFILSKGDALTFDPRRLHTFYNPSDSEPTTAIFVMTPKPR